MNGLGDHDHRRPAAEAVRLLDRRRRLPRGGAGVLHQPRRDRRDRRSCVGVAVLAVLLVLPRFTKRVPAILVAVVGATVVSAVLGLVGRGRGDGRRAAAGRADAGAPVDRAQRRRAAAARRRGHHAGVADRHDRHRDELRGPAGRRGRARPGDDRRWAPRTSPPASSRGSRSRPAASRTAVAEQSGAKTPAHRPRRAPAVVGRCSCFLNSLLADLPQTALAAVVIAAALSLMDLVAAAALRAGAAERARAVARRHRRRRSLFGVLQGIVSPIVLAILLFFRRNWWPHGVVLGQVDGVERLARRRAAPGGPRSSPGIVVYRWEAPLFFANAGVFRRADPAPGPRAPSRTGSCCSARPSPTST